MSSITDDPRPLDVRAFGARVDPHRRELHVHCYRLLGSFEEAEDVVQEASGSLRCVVTRASGQPAVAGNVRKPGDAACEPLAIHVLRVRDGIVTFDGAVFEHFDLPARLRAAGGPR